MVNLHLPKISVNQNVVFLILILIILGAAEYFNIKSVFWISLILAIWMAISVGLSMNWYTLHYIKKKRGRIQRKND